MKLAQLRVGGIYRLPSGEAVRVTSLENPGRYAGTVQIQWLDPNPRYGVYRKDPVLHCRELWMGERQFQREARQLARTIRALIAGAGIQPAWVTPCSPRYTFVGLRGSQVIGWLDQLGHTGAAADLRARRFGTKHAKRADATAAVHALRAAIIEPVPDNQHGIWVRSEKRQQTWYLRLLADPAHITWMLDSITAGCSPQSSMLTSLLP